MKVTIDMFNVSETYSCHRSIRALPITAYERAWKTQKWESSSAIDKSGRRRNCSGNKTNFPFPFNSAARNARMRELMSISSRRTFNCLPFTVLLMVHNLSAHNKMWKKRGSLIYRPSLKFHYTLVKPRDWLVDSSPNVTTRTFASEIDFSIFSSFSQLLSHHHQFSSCTARREI